MKRSVFLLQAFILLLSWVNSSLSLLMHRNSPCVHRRRTALLSHSSHGDNSAQSEPFDDSRRSLVRTALVTLSAAFTAGSSLFGCEADARGLVRFPCNDKPLLNTYHFMRAGSSLLEIEDVWSTNPLFLTNREAALSEQGEEEVRQACNLLKKSGLNPSIVRYSLAASSIDTANIVGAEFNIGRDRLVPEFNYLDPRAIGRWDFSPKNVTEEAVWAMDADEAGPSGRGGRPPPNEDGTPSETLSDQVVRLTNLMSVLETLYSGDEILLVFPDGTGPALLSCLIGGIPLDRVHELNFRSGEIRENVDYSSVNALMTELPSPYYSEIIQRGRRELSLLRENPDEQRNVKELKFEKEQVFAEAQRKERQELEERKARQNELERKQKLEDERIRKEEQRKERQLQAQQREKERTRMRENKNNSSVVGGAVAAGGILFLASTSANTVDKNLEQNVTIAEASNVDAEELEVTLSSAALEDAEEVKVSSVVEDETGSRELDQPLTLELALVANHIDDLIDLEETYDWGDTWLGTINEIMNENDPDVSSKSE